MSNLQITTNLLLNAAREASTLELTKSSDRRTVHGWWKRNRNALQKAGIDRAEANSLMTDLQNEVLK